MEELLFPIITWEKTHHCFQEMPNEGEECIVLAAVSVINPSHFCWQQVLISDKLS